MQSVILTAKVQNEVPKYFAVGREAVLFTD